MRAKKLSNLLYNRLKHGKPEMLSCLHLPSRTANVLKTMKTFSFLAAYTAQIRSILVTFFLLGHNISIHNLKRDRFILAHIL